MASQLNEATTRELLEVAIEAASAGKDATLTHFLSREMVVANKQSEAFDPVTAADRDAELAIRTALQKCRPEDGILGEEFAPVEGRSGFTWVIDPIDGTRSFIIGVPLWTTLIALHDGVRPIVGVICQPYLDEVFWGIVGDGFREAGYQRRGTTGALQTRACNHFEDASVATTHRDAFANDRDYCAFREIEIRCRQSRHGGDAYHYAMLADGRIDLVIESGLERYDVAAVIPVIEGAGGVISDWNGNDCSNGGRVLASGGVPMHTKVVNLLPQ